MEEQRDLRIMIKTITKMATFFCFSAIAIFFVFQYLRFGLLWRSMEPLVAGPVVQAIALLLIITAIQLIMQKNSEQKYGYAITGMLLVVTGLLMVGTRYGIAPVSPRFLMMLGLPVLLAEACLSLLASYLAQLFNRKLRVVLGLTLLIAAFLVPGVLIERFSRGE